MDKRFDSPSRKSFIVVNSILMVVLAGLCIAPMIHVLAVSLSSSAEADAGFVKFWPVNFNVQSYSYVLEKRMFWDSIGVTLKRVFIGVPINLALVVLTAYPLSKERHKFKMRTLYVWVFFFTMLFSGGLMPSYLLIYYLGLMDTIWALILPGALPVFNVILMLNFFRGLPNELEEAALIDGAGHWSTLFKIYIPCSLPSIATITLFSIVGHWNAYFDGYIYSNFPRNYPLQTYLRSIIIMRDFASMSGEEWKLLAVISDRTVKAAQIFVGALPILAVYPFLQRFFIKGIVIGSVKG